MEMEMDMERSFHEGCNFRGDSFKRFSEHMRESVWFFRIWYKNKESKQVMETMATGVCIDPSGLVLSVHHCFQHEGAEIYGRPYRDGDYDYDITRPESGHKFKVKILKSKPAHDLVMLKVERLELEKPKEKSGKKARKAGKVSNDRFWYSTLALKGDLLVGEKLIHIGHPDGRMFATSKTYINYPAPACDCSSWRTIKLDWPPHGYTYRVSEDYEDEYPEEKILVITTHSSDSGRGSSGSPLFNAYGTIVGLLKGGNGSESDHIHVAVLREFIEDVKAGLN